MRLLRALAHLVLALALIGAGAAPVRAAPVVIFAPHAAAGPAVANPGDVVAAERGQDHGDCGNQHPVHERDGCQAACCFIPSQLPPHAPRPSAAAFFCAVRYARAADPASGRGEAPELGIPKRVA